MARIDNKNEQLINLVTEMLLGEKLIIKIIGISKVQHFEDAFYIIDFQDAKTGEKYFIIPGTYTMLSIKLAGQIFWERGKEFRNTPLVLTVSNKGELVFNFDFRYRISAQCG